MFMSKKDKLFYKKYVAGNISLGKILYTMQWLNIFLALLNFVLKNYIAALIISVIGLINIALYLKTRNEFCKKIEKEIIGKTIQANIEEYAKETKQHIKIAEYMYLKNGNFFNRDLKQAYDAVNEFYDNL